MCECQKCCSFPQGNKAAVALVLTVIASFITGAFSGCLFFKIDATKVTEGTLSSTSEDTLFFGFSGYETDGTKFWSTCNRWSPADYGTYFDNSLYAAALFSFFSALLCFISCIGGITLACARCEVCCLYVLTVMAVLSGICAPLGLVGFQSDFCKQTNCQFAIGSGFAVASLFVMMLPAWAFQRITKRPPEEQPFAFSEGTPTSGAAEEHAVAVAPSVTEKEEVFPDGTVKTTRTTVHPDGSQTVEETVEEPLAKNFEAKTF